MGTTFMTIHDLTPQANILFASESIVTVLGYQPYEVISQSCFDYFHPDELPFVQHVHSRGVQLDEAAVLYYARIMDRNGEWISCECIFSIAYNVLVACSSIYKYDTKSQRLATEALITRRLFASSLPSTKFHGASYGAPKPTIREPRTVLILNRFTRSLTIMFATHAVASILGVTAEQINGKSFYELVEENCLLNAIGCLEAAKASDCIAYLRFWCRDLRRQDGLDRLERDVSYCCAGDVGVQLSNHLDVELYKTAHSSDQNAPSDGRSISLNAPEVHQRHLVVSARPFEMEAAISCTSDGLVVILRCARRVMYSSWLAHVAT